MTCMVALQSCPCQNHPKYPRPYYTRMWLITFSVLVGVALTGAVRTATNILSHIDVKDDNIRDSMEYPKVDYQDAQSFVNP